MATNPLMDFMKKKATTTPADDSQSDLSDCAQDVLDAIKADSSEQLADALGDFISLAGPGKPDVESDGDEGEDADEGE